LSLCATVAGVAQRQNAAMILKTNRFLPVFIIAPLILRFLFGLKVDEIRCGDRSLDLPEP
jgi:hypothetical protein